MAKADSAGGSVDPAQTLKRQARRRLVGALILGSAAAISLPLLLDHEPRYQRPEVRVDMGASQSAPSPGSSPAPAETGASGLTAASGPQAAEPPPSPAQSAVQSGRTGATMHGDAKNAARGDANGPARGEAMASARGDSSVSLRAEGPVAPRVEVAPRTEPPSRPESPRLSPRSDTSASAPVSRESRAQPAASSSSPPYSLATPLPGQSQASAQTQPNVPAASTASGNHILQLGAFAQPAGARAIEDRAATMGLRAWRETVQTPQGERIRVRVGPFPSRAAAEEVRSRLKAAGMDATLVSP